MVEAMSDIFAENAAKVMVRPGTVETWVVRMVNFASGASDCIGTSIVFPINSSVDVGPVAQQIVGNYCARFASGATRIFRSAAFARSASQEVARALTVRSSHVKI